MELKSVPSSSSKMESKIKSDPSSAAKMELKSVQDPLILEIVPILVPHFSNFFAKVVAEKEGRVFGGWGEGVDGRVGRASRSDVLIYIYFTHSEKMNR